MYTSTTFIFAILALARITLATPPACLIAALGEQTNPSDFKALCGTLEPAMQGNITEKCGDSADSAFSIYSSTCLASASITVTSIAASTSTSASGTGTATSNSASGTATGGASATATATETKASGSSSTTATGTGANASSTGNSGSFNSPQLIASIVLVASFAAQYIL